MAASVHSTRAVAVCNLDGSALHAPTDLFISPALRLRSGCSRALDGRARGGANVRALRRFCRPALHRVRLVR
jgi:hypothetical protein